MNSDDEDDKKSLLKSKDKSEDSDDKPGNSEHQFCCCCSLGFGTGLIMFLTIIFSISLIVIVIYFYMNVYFDITYKFYSTCIIIPLFAGIFLAFFFICGKDSYQTRMYAKTSVIIFWIVLTLFCLWNIVYIWTLYNEPKVNIGTGPTTTDPEDPEPGVSPNYKQM